MVPLVRIGLTTPSLPRRCATTTLQRRVRFFYQTFLHLSSFKFPLFVENLLDLFDRA